jgi:hypothetical protein
MDAGVAGWPSGFAVVAGWRRGGQVGRLGQSRMRMEDRPMPDVSSTAPADVRLWVALDVHEHSIVAATLPPAGGAPRLQRVENGEGAIRRLIDRLGGPGGAGGRLRGGPVRL